jgi:hypothetical protein
MGRMSTDRKLDLAGPAYRRLWSALGVWEA